MNQKLVFWTALNSYQSFKLLRDKPLSTTHPVQTEEWTARRIELFRRFTLPSILNQRYEDWLFVVLLDPALRHLTDPFLVPRHPDDRVIYCYEDGPALERLRQYDQVVMTLIDGDDMYSEDAGQMIMDCPDEWMYFRLGYALDVPTGRLWAYDTIGTGPFWARRIDPKTISRLDRDKRHPTHKAIINHGPTELPADQFCVTLHDINTSSHAQMRYVLQGQPRDIKILERFGGGG